MNLRQMLDHIRTSPEILSCLTDWRVLKAQEAIYEDIPASVEPRLRETLQKRGISRLFCHQSQAFQAVQEGTNVAIVTPTASGKTLCYNLPVLNRILREPNARALYLFPTKALSQDQVQELHEMVTVLDADIKTFTFDGDTPQTARRAIRSAGHIVVTNPDMLHMGILPHHTKWIRLFENLKFVVIDEVHHYRGVFGSHLGNVIRRLKRIAAFYGAEPQFVLCSATIANPKELAQSLIEEEVLLIDKNGAPRGEKHFILYNPPVLNKELGIRRSSVKESQRLAANLVKNGIQTIVFGRSRLVVEVLTTYLKEAMARSKRPASSIRGYRGGYLPLERREIERGLRDGSIKGVVSTNALELGIDIGQLEACIMTGYPGNISSTWQQAGRAGRRQDVSLAILVATSSPLDQFMINHPDYFFDQSPESGIVDPDNLVILTNHLKCAAFELPFKEGERFGNRDVEDLLRHLAENGVLHFSRGKWHWMSDIYPAQEVSLRVASLENFVIVDSTDDARVIGEVDYFSAPFLIHEDAIYLHQSEQYHIDRLDWERRRAYARQVDVDYYTDCESKTDIKVLDTGEEKEAGPCRKFLGDVSVTTMAVLFKKIKFHTHENVGWGKVALPEQEMHTTSFWIELPTDIAATMVLEEEALSGGLVAIAHLLQNVVPIYAMCDPTDIRSVAMVRSPFSGCPTVYVYDNVPGGVGFSRKVFSMHEDLLRAARDLVQRCSCESGCPSCIGPTLEIHERGKQTTVDLLSFMLGEKAEYSVSPESHQAVTGRQESEDS